MKYTFNIDENIKTDKIKEKNKMNFYLGAYNFIHNYKYPASLLLALLIYFIFDYVCAIDPAFVLNKINFIFHMILAISISQFFFCLFELFFNTERLYSKVSNFIGHDIFVRELTVFNDHINDKLKESEIVPGIKIKYDIKKISNKKFALIFKIDDNNYKVVEILECDHIEHKIEKNIYSDKILKCIRETDDKCVTQNGVLWANIVLLKNNKIKTNDIINTSDINTDLLLTELFFVPYVHEKKEGLE